jgi:hypothetical protein
MSFINIPDEIIILTNELYLKLQQLCPEVKVEISNDGPQFSTNIIETPVELVDNIDSFNLFDFEKEENLNLITLPEIDTTLEQLFESSVEPIQQISISEENSTRINQTWMPLEEDVINTIKDALKDNQLAEQPPRLSSTERSLETYKELLKDSKYTTLSIYYEIGRILSDLTSNHKLTRRQHSNSRRLFKEKISIVDATSKHALVLRIYQYFNGHKNILRSYKMDKQLTPGIIGKISQKTSDQLKERIALHISNSTSY